MVVTEPIREELKWRKELLEFVNYDILESRTCRKIVLPTLHPLETSETLEQEIYKNRICRKSNLYLAPLGSKTQTAGCYLLWRRNLDVSVLFSRPSEYYPDRYSEGFGCTFVFSYEQMANHVKGKIKLSDIKLSA